MKNIFVIPTDKPSRLGYLTKKGKEVYKDLRLFDRLMPKILDSENVNIYITNSEEIKFNDYITDGYKVWQWKDDSSLLGRKKVILTTDQDLIKDGVQKIDDEFLEWFVKNPSCEEVEVVENIKNLNVDELRERHLKKLPHLYSEKIGYKTIIPKEEPKQETIEESYLNKLIDEANQEFTLDRKLAKEVAIKFSKWQQERSYNEEDMEEYSEYVSLVGTPKSPKEWFEQFKKK